jgi:RNA polymerase sigma factor for flagellar operon FliA
MTAQRSRAPRRLSAEETLALWQEYQDTSDGRIRDRLILTFAPMVKYIVYRKVREMPANAEVEDFLSCGIEALIQSIDRYDPEKGATLEQYAWTRIHGAILDELRRQDWAPRSVRRWERDITKAIDEFTVLYRRRPTLAELADSMGTTVAEIRKRQDEITTSDVTSLNALVLSDEGTTIERVATLAATDRRLDPEHAAGTEELKRKFREAFAKLPQREREVAVLLYVKNLTLAEIGEILGVSESRVCQIHSALKRTLRETLNTSRDLAELVA